MAVILGGEELPNVQEITTDEHRSLVEHRIPGRDGPVLQDLGEGLTVIRLSGIIHGESAREALTALRGRFQEGEPAPFTADITTGIDVLDVVIRRFTIRQIAGYASRYGYTVELARYIEPASGDESGLDAVESDIDDSADTWMEEVAGREAALQDPSVLPEVLAETPGALDQLGMDELGASITENVGDLSGEEFGDIIGSVSELSPEDAMGLLDSVKDAGGLGDILDKYVEEGKDLLEDLTDMSVDELTTIAKGFIGGTDFLKRAKSVGESAKNVLDALKKANPFGSLFS